MKQALEAIEELQSKVDTLIVISNDKLLQIVPDNTPVSSLSLFSRFQKFPCLMHCAHKRLQMRFWLRMIFFDRVSSVYPK